jgi:hypothetical protein
VDVLATEAGPEAVTMSVPELSDLHMLVLAWFRSHDGYPEDAAEV